MDIYCNNDLSKKRIKYIDKTLSFDSNGTAYTDLDCNSCCILQIRSFNESWKIYIPLANNIYNVIVIKAYYMLDLTNPGAFMTDARIFYAENIQ